MYFNAYMMVPHKGKGNFGYDIVPVFDTQGLEHPLIIRFLESTVSNTRRAEQHYLIVSVRVVIFQIHSTQNCQRRTLRMPGYFYLMNVAGHRSVYDIPYGRGLICLKESGMYPYF